MKRAPPIVLVLAAALPTMAQQAAPTAAAAPPQVADGPAAPLPDIEFAADIHMDSMSFGSAPRARVEFFGGPRAESRHQVDRGTLPDAVRAGTTYRNVNVRTNLSVTLLDPAAPAASPAPPNPEDVP